jgi:hypothetical protein
MNKITRRSSWVYVSDNNETVFLVIDKTPDEAESLFKLECSLRGLEYGGWDCTLELNYNSTGCYPIMAKEKK